VLHYLLARKVDLELQQGTGGLASLTALLADDLMRDQLPPAEKVKEVIARLEAARNLPSERMVKITDFAGYTYTEWQNQPDADEKLFDNIVALGPVELTDDQHRRLVLTVGTGAALFTEPGQPDRVGETVDRELMSSMFGAFRRNDLDLLRTTKSLVPSR
jgi:hypothetical protein